VSKELVTRTISLFVNELRKQGGDQIKSNMNNLR
jgi:hypothetical protein